MKFKLGDRVYWEDRERPINIKGVVTKIIGDNIVITWENMRVIQYTTDMLNSMGDSSISGIIRIDYQRMRNEKLRELDL